MRHELDEAETAQFLAAMQTCLASLRQALVEGTFRIVGQVSPTADVVARVRTWLENPRAEIVIADSPRAG